MKTCAALILALIFLVTASALHAQVPQLINYQGRVAVGTVNFDGSGSFKFALVNTDGSVTYWSNDGTSTIGDEPTAAVSLIVTKGLYSVLLGDASLTNMTAILASVFDNSDVRLRVWFNDGTNGSQLLTPDQRLAPAAYLANGAVTSASIAAGAVTSPAIAAGAVNGTHVAPGSLNFSHLIVPNAPGAGQVLGFDGSELSWVTPGGGSGPWLLNGTTAFYNAGSVGIGTTTPFSKLAVKTGSGLYGFTHTDGTITVGSYIGGSQSAATGGWLGTYSNHPLYFFVNNGQPSMTIGLGGATTMTPLGGYGSTTFGTPNGESGMSIIGGNRADVRFDGSTLKLLAGFGPGAMPSTNGIAITTSGNVGIGTNGPGAKLDVITSGDAIHGTSTGGGGTAGVYGTSTSSGVGVYGIASGNDAGGGVIGISLGNGIGVYGTSATGYAGYFAGNVNVTGTVYAQNVRGSSHNGFAGVYGENASPTGWSGYFAGNVYVGGNLSKPGGSFKIDHPLDPENKTLSHSFVESPDMMNIYNGNTALDGKGEAVVVLPEWFGALNKEFRYQLTCLGGFAPVYIAEEIADNRFKIAGGKPGMKVSWQVTGVRQDAWANAHRIPVEEEKASVERGFYLHPEAFGLPAEMSVERAHHPEMLPRIKEPPAISRSSPPPQPER